MTKCDVLQVKEELAYAEKMFVNAERTALTCKQDFLTQQSKFRESEVKYVLENLQYLINHDMIGKHDIDLYLCHCQNVLNGNLDGTVLDFAKYYEKKEEEDGSE